MRMISTRNQRHITHGQERRSDAKETQRRSHVKAGCSPIVVPEELVSLYRVSVPSLHLGSSCCRPGGYKVTPSINPVPNLKFEHN